MEGLKDMTGDEFVKKILHGERDFSGVSLDYGFNLNKHDCFIEVEKYLKTHEKEFEKNPISIEGSQLIYLTANFIHLPYLRARKADLTWSYLGADNFRNADFSEAQLRGTRFFGSDVVGLIYENATGITNETFEGASKIDKNSASNTDSNYKQINNLKKQSVYVTSEASLKKLLNKH